MQARRDLVPKLSGNHEKITDEKAIRMNKNGRSVSATRSTLGTPVQKTSMVVSQKQKLDVKDYEEEDEENDFIPDSMMEAIREATTAAVKMNDRGKTFKTNDSKNKIVRTKRSPMKSIKIVNSSAPIPSVSQKPALSTSSNKKRSTVDIQNDTKHTTVKDPSFLSPTSMPNLQEVEKISNVKSITHTPSVTTSGVSLSQPRMKRSLSTSKYTTSDSITKSERKDDPIISSARSASMVVPVVAKARITASNIDSPSSLNQRLDNVEKHPEYTNSSYNNDSVRSKLEFPESLLQSKLDRNAFKETEELTHKETDPTMTTPSTTKIQNNDGLVSPHGNVENISRVRVKARKDILPRQSPFSIPRGAVGSPYKTRQSSTTEYENERNVQSEVAILNNELEKQIGINIAENLSNSKERLLNNTVSPIKKINRMNSTDTVSPIKKINRMSSIDIDSTVSPIKKINRMNSIGIDIHNKDLGTHILPGNLVLIYNTYVIHIRVNAHVSV